MSESGREDPGSFDAPRKGTRRPYPTLWRSKLLGVWVTEKVSTSYLP